MYRVPLLEDESLTSFCSRFAAANVKSAPDFCLDMGFQYSDVINGKEVAIQTLAELSRISIDQIRRASIGKDGKNWIVGGEAILEKFYVRTGLRVCPLCFAEDEKSSERMPGTRRYMRKIWPLQFVRTCQHHNCALNDFGRSLLTSIRCHDLIENLSVAEIDPGFGAVRPRPMTDFERFAIDRLNGIRRHGSILDAMSLDRGGYLAQIIGTGLLFGKDADQESLDDERLWQAGAEGYNYLSRGVTGLHDAMDVFHERAKNYVSVIGGGKLYGRFYSIMWHQKDPAWDDVKKAMHEYAFASLPLSKSANVFGTSDTARYLSEKELRQTFGVRPTLLRKFAVAMNLMDVCSSNSGAMSREAAYKAYELMEDSILPAEAAAMVGVSYAQFTKFRQAGIFSPSIKAMRQVGLNERFSRKALQAVVDGLRPDRTGSFEDLLPLNAAAKACGLQMPEIILLLQSKRLRNLTWDNHKVGFDAIRVDPKEIQSLCRTAALVDLTMAEADEILRIGVDNLKVLCNAGYVTSYMAKNSQNRLIRYIVAEDLHAFYDKYATVRGAVRRHQVTLKRLQLALRLSNVKAVIAKAGRFPEFYLCSEVSNALKEVENITVPGERDDTSYTWFR
ncbi:TniQ family protein [Rhizobium sp. CB3090]|uniref:TniQ family protein n=1 Tax=Rhizobium sp. CB3090 TaxID=3039156 RepID=UPI0024B0EDBC|nr:TniQ family protein [Rhizobium sp. CB3090]WFU10295.1 TniQ family protein [Rhizobium sp. CB3090]